MHIDWNKENFAPRHIIVLDFNTEFHDLKVHYLDLFDRVILQVYFILNICNLISKK